MATFECPRCHKVSEAPKGSKVNCGDCLFNDIEVVELKPTLEGVKELHNTIARALGE